MAEPSVKEAALRLRALADRCRVDGHREHPAPHQGAVDAAIEFRLAEQAAAIAELSRRVAELSELVRRSTVGPSEPAVPAGPRRTGRPALLLVTMGIAALGLVGWAWARGDFGAIVDQALRLAGAAVGS